jgi:bis(5'-nucleosyl)-tetraphosphatase (symmetrical)
VATYIVGDIQGCLDELQLLLTQVEFSISTDTLWFAGDLVARGPKSLETLRFAHELGDAAKVVLGNHDLHLLAVAIGTQPIKSKDKTAAIFDAPDRDMLLNWLRKQPLLLEHDEFIVCHAGISPQWNLTTARQSAKEVEAILQSDHWTWLIEQMYSNTPELWSEQLIGIERYRYIINSFTRMRYCFSDYRLDMACKLPPSQVSNVLTPWFNMENRVIIDKTIIFGHWAALEGYLSDDVIGLDTGCVWGGDLTMLRWEDKQLFKQPALVTKKSN